MQQVKGKMTTDGPADAVSEHRALLRRAWDQHLTRPSTAFSLASEALTLSKQADDAKTAAWAQLCKALAGYRWLEADAEHVHDDFARAAEAMASVYDTRGMRLAALAPAIIAGKRGQWQDALTQYEALIGTFDLNTLDADNFYPLLGLSTSYVYCGNLAEGLRFGYSGLHLSQQLALAPQEVNMCLPLGVALMAARDAPEAATLYESAEQIAESIDSPMLLRTVRNNRAVALRRMGRIDDAESLVNKVLAEPCSMIGGAQFAHYSAAELYILRDRLDLAEAHLEAAHAALKGKPLQPLDAAKLHFIAGLIASRRNHFPRAIEEFAQVDALLPTLSAWRFSDRAQVYDELAAAYAQQAMFEEAYRTQKKSSHDYLINVEVLNRVRHFSMQVRQEISRVRSELERESRQRLDLQDAHRKLREQAEHTAREAMSLREAATHDALTGLPNRRYLDETLPKMLRLGQQTATPLAIAFLDIDHFKLVNDRHGHAMGDEVLRGIGRLAPGFMRGSDLMGRYGGEEFCVALIGCGPAAAVKRIRGLLETVRRQEFRSGIDQIADVTFSAGIAVYPEDGVELAALMATADRRLYEAKNAGRARVLCDERIVAGEQHTLAD